MHIRDRWIESRTVIRRREVERNKVRESDGEREWVTRDRWMESINEAWRREIERDVVRERDEDREWDRGSRVEVERGR